MAVRLREHAAIGTGVIAELEPFETLLPRLIAGRADTVIVDAAPGALIKVPPEYPDIAREAGVSGTVQVDVLVCRNGLVYATAIAPGRSILIPRRRSRKPL